MARRPEPSDTARRHEGHCEVGGEQDVGLIAEEVGRKQRVDSTQHMGERSGDSTHFAAH